MLFPTYEFAVFFALVFAVTWLLRQNLSRKWFLVVASFFFYGFWDWRFTFLLAQCALSNYAIGRVLQQTAPSQKKKRQLLVATAVVLNLAILAFFKYFGFFIGSMQDLLMAMNLERDLPMMEIILPVGVSFFTFQGISYIVDVYHNKIRGDRPVCDVLLYISFFPQLVAGPIVRADRFLPQLDRTPDPTKIKAAFAFTLIALGLIKKSFIAHYLSQELVAPAFADPLGYGTFDLVIAVYGYALQIYCDFSAYSDIAIGVAALLGYHFDKNFDQPYRSQSLQEFWRRWHISLSSWLRDYLYIPLGGNRGGKWLNYRNLFLTMLLGGLWHGAAWNFVLWGVMHGTYLGIEKWCRERFGSFGRGATSRMIATLLVFHFVCLTWVFFASPNFAAAWEYLAGLGNMKQGVSLVTPFTLLLVFGALVFQFFPQNWSKHLEIRLANLPVPAQGLVLGMTLVVLAAIGPRGVLPFIYFQF